MALRAGFRIGPNISGDLGLEYPRNGFRQKEGFLLQETLDRRKGRVVIKVTRSDSQVSAFLTIEMKREGCDQPGGFLRRRAILLVRISVDSAHLEPMICGIRNFCGTPRG
jgi:hypothetical protein